MDYSKLIEQIEKAEELKATDYTENSWKVLADALEAGKAALESKDQSIVDNAANALKAAIENLERVEEEQPAKFPIGWMVVVIVVLLASVTTVVVRAIIQKKKKLV